MKISIITVCFNSDKTIEETFKSVKNQTYEEIEYIVVDGGSKDKTLDIIASHENDIDFWVSEPDNGLYDAINKGIKKATGDFVGILNSDDIFYESNTVEKIADFIKGHPDIDAVTGDIVQHKNNRIVRKYSSDKWTPEKLKSGFMPPHPSIFIRTKLFEILGYYCTDYKIGADYELIIRYFLKQNIQYKYSGIITTSMAVGGASSSGLKSYKIITKEIKKAFDDNGMQFNFSKVKYRFIWKLLGYIKRS